MAEKREKLLVVDDEEAVGNLLKEMLEEVGYQVTTATNGEDALHEVSLEKAGVVLLDVLMPGMSGIEVLEKLTTERPDVCVIMVTAVTDTQTVIDAMKMGAYDYITKPFNQDEVIKKVQKAIQGWIRLLQEKHRYVQLSESLTEQTERMQKQFNELISSLAREHKLLLELSAKQSGGGKALLSKLPPELQKPMSSVEEFRDALIRILKRS